MTRGTYTAAVIVGSIVVGGLAWARWGNSETPDPLDQCRQDRPRARRGVRVGSDILGRLTS